MEGNEEGRHLSVYEYQADVREPYMGNTVPVSVFIYTNEKDIWMVEVGTEEGGKRTATLKSFGKTNLSPGKGVNG